MKQRRVGVFGGTFDPVHLGHLIMATELQFALRLDHVLFVPAGDPPHKPELPITDGAHRIAMLTGAILNRDSFSINLVDVERPGPSYTKETLARLSRQYQDETLVFLMGEDSLRDFPTWNSPEQIVARAEIGVGARPGVNVDLERVYSAVPSARGRVTVVEIPLIGISSSDIRRRVAENQPIAFQVPENVEKYIADHCLYRKQTGKT